MSSPNAADSSTNAIAGPSTPTTHTPGVFAVPHPPSHQSPPSHRRLIQDESDHEEDGGATDSGSDNEQEGSVADISGGEDDTAETPTTQVGTHKTQFRKFLLPECELILLRALNDVRPFSNKRGAATKLWEQVELYLHKHDAARKRRNNAEPHFTDVTVRACKSKWNVIISERNTLIQEIFEYEKSIERELESKRKEQERQRKRKADDREDGRLLLEQSRAGPRRRINVSASESDQDTGVSQHEPQQQEGGTATEYESDTSTASATRANPTPTRRRRVFVSALDSQFETASNSTP
ncbi:hypothetical protein MVEG_05678 [Podila verticillata NRRL 6337]|nr:hypothetical protein MVEG_05678 [Podila verticillata NRRL 6337]